MRWIKYTLIFLAGLIVLILVLVAVVLVTFENDDYRRLVASSVKFFTGYSITIEGPFAMELSAEPSISAEAIQFDPGADGAPPPVRTIGKLKIQIALSPLLKGVLLIRQLLLEDAVMTVTIEEKGEPEDRRVFTGPAAPDITIPILESVHLRNIHLDVIDAAANRNVEIRLQKFDIDDIRDTGPLFINGEGSVGGNDFKIDGRMGALAAMLKGAEPYPVFLNLTSSGFELSVSGTVENLADGEGLKLRLSGETDELSNLFKLLQMDVPPLGHLKLEAGIAHDISAPKVSYLDIKLFGEPQVGFAVSGSIVDAISGKGANIQFSGSCENPDIFKLLLPAELPPLSQIRMAGKLQEAQGEIAVENLTVDAIAEQGLKVSVDGRIVLGDNISKPSVNAVDVNIKLSAPNTALLKSYVIDSVPEMSPISAQARLTGPLAQLSLEDISVEAGGSGPLRLTSKGRIGRLTGAADMTVSEMDLSASLQASNTRLLVSGFGIEVPELGSVSLRTLIRGSSERFQLSEIDARTSHAKGLKVRLSGNIAFEQHKKRGLLGNMDLQARIDAPTIRGAFVPLGVTDLPDVKPVRASAQVGGTTEVLSLKKIALSIGQSSPLHMQVNGEVKQIPLAGERPLSGVKLSALFQAENTSALSTILGVAIPDFGPLQMKANINDGSGGLDVETFEIRSDSGKEAFFLMQGKILRITDFKQMALQAAFETASQPWVGTYLQQPQAKSYPLAGSIKISGDQDGLLVQEVQFGTADKKGLVLKAQGRINHPFASPEMDLELVVSAPDPPAVGSMVGVSLPPLNALAINGRLNGNEQKVAFEGQTRIGETTFRSKVSGAFAAERPRIDAMFAAASVDLETMGIYPEVSPDNAVQTPELKSSKGGRLFNDEPLSFEALGVLDLHFALDVDKLTGRNLTIENLDLDILLENGRLRIHPASTVYTAGFTSAEFVIDASGSTPKFILKFKGEDIDVDDMLAYAHEPVILSGALSLVVNLYSWGSSAREIASNLGGEFSMALENGRIRRIIDFLSMDAFDAVLTAADRRKYTDLQCHVSKIQFQDGLGTIKIFFMDTPKIRTKAAGKVNLAEETIDLVIYPKKKGKLFKKGSAIRIKGSLAKPSVKTMPLSEAAHLYGDIFMPYVFIPARALGYLWSMVSKDKEATPCVFEKR